MEDNNVKAIGFPLASRTMLHGKAIPEGSICVQVIHTSAADIPAPIVLGHEEENAVLKNNMFFALPINNLFNYLYNKSTNSVKLSHYVRV